MPKSIKEVENQLQVNRRFFQERKNLETQAEIKIKKASRIELRRNQRKQKRYEQDLKDADENLKYFEQESELQKVKWKQDNHKRSIKIE